jgi:hypothetical protein
MRNKYLFFGILVILLSGLTLTGCETEPPELPEPTEKTYTVWSYTASYSEYSNTFGALSDGYYRRTEVFSGEINYSAIPTEYKRNWTENEIYNWFLGRDFISSEANQMKAWVITHEHCLVASRSGSIVYMLIK